MPDTTRGPRTRLWSNLALVVFGLVAGLLVLEAVLRLAALVVERRHATAPGETGETALPILALGDSNTFGLYVGKQRAYPHELEQRWNAAAPARSIRVVNAGYPGNSSSTVREQLGTLLATHRPAIVTIMIGGNDWWRKPEPLDDASVDACIQRALAPPDPKAPPPHHEWRVVRAARLLGQWLPVPLQQFMQARPPTRDAADEAWPAELGVNLRFIVACIRHAGSRPVLLTYPSHFGPYGVANRTIRSVAIGESAPLVDLARTIGERCPTSRCDYLYPPPDQHPTVAGHAWMGEIMAAQLAGVIESAMP